MADAQAQPASDADRGRILAIVTYGLFLAALLNGLTALIGVVLAYVGRSEARGTVYESHYSNAITVFWVGLVGSAILLALVLACVAAFFSGSIDLEAAHIHNHVTFNPLGLVFVPVLGLGWIAILIWYLYRIIGGLARAVDGKPYR